MDSTFALLILAWIAAVLSPFFLPLLFVAYVLVRKGNVGFKTAIAMAVAESIATAASYYAVFFV